MRLLIVLCLILFISGNPLFPQNNISRLDQNLIKENGISGVTEWNHEYKGGNPSETGTISLRARYDKNGYTLEEITFDSRGQESRKITNRYDNKGNRIGHTVFDSKNNRITFSQMAGFDEQGNKIAEWGFDGLGNYRNKYQLNPDGSVSEIHYTTQGRLKEERVFDYSDNKTLITVVLPDNSIAEKIRLLHNSTGEMIEEAYYDNQDNLRRKIEYTYNRAGKKTEERRYNGSEMQYRKRFLYDNNLLQKIIKTDRTGVDVVTNYYTYDENGNLIKEAWYNKNADDYSTREFSWDNQGNVTSVASYYASYQFQVLYRYDYSFFY